MACFECWSEPAATNAPVEDEPVQPVLRMNILPASRDFFFSPPLCPEILYLPPPTYQPHPPSLPRQSSRDLERLWSGSWSCGCGAGAGVGVAGVGAGPTRPRKCKMLMFFFCFFCLFCLKKAWEVSSFFAAEEDEGLFLLLPLSLLHCNLATAQKKKAFFFFLFLCCIVAQLQRSKEEGLLLLLLLFCSKEGLLLLLFCNKEEGLLFFCSRRRRKPFSFSFL